MVTVILAVLYLRYRDQQSRALGLEQDMASACCAIVFAGDRGKVTH
jgi:hypothetical protein